MSETSIIEKTAEACEYVDCDTDVYAKGTCYRHYKLRWTRPDGVTLREVRALPAPAYNTLVTVMANTGHTAEGVLEQALALLAEARA